MFLLRVVAQVSGLSLRTIQPSTDWLASNASTCCWLVSKKLVDRVSSLSQSFLSLRPHFSFFSFSSFFSSFIRPCRTSVATEQRHWRANFRFISFPRIPIRPNYAFPYFSLYFFLFTLHPTNYFWRENRSIHYYFH